MVLEVEWNGFLVAVFEHTVAVVVLYKVRQIYRALVDYKLAVRGIHSVRPLIVVETLEVNVVLARASSRQDNRLIVPDILVDTVVGTPDYLRLVCVGERHGFVPLLAVVVGFSAVRDGFYVVLYVVAAVHKVRRGYFLFVDYERKFERVAASVRPAVDTLRRKRNGVSTRVQRPDGEYVIRNVVSESARVDVHLIARNVHYAKRLLGAVIGHALFVNALVIADYIRLDRNSLGTYLELERHVVGDFTVLVRRRPDYISLRSRIL